MDAVGKESRQQRLERIESQQKHSQEGQAQSGFFTDETNGASQSELTTDPPF